MNNDEYCRFMFRRVMDYLKNNKVMEAGMSFASD
jgi:hypothetical protein